VSDTSDPLGPQDFDAVPRSGWHRLRNYFLTGLVVVVPLFLTVYLTWALIMWIDSWVTPLIPAAYKPDKWLPVSIPGFGVLIALFVITLLGFLTANLAGRTFVAWGESLLARTPLIRNLYRGLKQIVETGGCRQDGHLRRSRPARLRARGRAPRRAGDHRGSEAPRPPGRTVQPAGIGASSKSPVGSPSMLVTFFSR